ncbi:YhfZ family protein [Dryocola clanedunensis]|uniref:YhfZ family protein n=1 Tax=Cedecea sulfonylureivorans TaxID=3051154 RepID=UPI0019259BEA|nr:YhfZ family protein [Cedecea sulfonylureivorans]
MSAKGEKSENISPEAFIARDILSPGFSGRLATTSQYQERLGIGSGTVQKALHELRQNGAVELVSRGHQGTWITRRDFDRLWDMARLPPVHILLPSRGSQEATVVAGGLSLQFQEWGVGTTIGYMRGARSRLEALDQGQTDVVLLSSGSASLLLPDDPDRYVKISLGVGSYYCPGSLVVVEKIAPATGRRRKIGIDFHSNDHQRLTRAQFPAELHDYVETDFTLLPRAVFLNEIDSGVWHQEESLIPLDKVGLSLRPLDEPEAVEMAEQISAAVLVAAQDSPVVTLLRELDRQHLQKLCATVDEKTGGKLSGTLAIRFD